LSILFIDLIFALVFRNVANSMQIYGLFSTKQALTNKKGAPMAALGPCALLVCCLPPSSFGIFSAHLAPSHSCFLAVHTLFYPTSLPFLAPTIVKRKF
jgi:hypothetical protein